MSKTNTITVGPGSDFAADSGAFLIKILRDLALDENAASSASSARSDWRTISAWLGSGDDELTAVDYERIGRAWRSYINLGVAPSIALEKPFQQMANKEGSAHHEGRIPAEVFKVFDRLIASDAEIAEKRNYDAARRALQVPAPSDAQWRMRFVATVMLAWLPLSFGVVPVLAILGIRWIRDGWPTILLGVAAILLVLAPALSILLLELRTLRRRPVNILGTLVVIAYNTAIFVAARYFLE